MEAKEVDENTVQLTSILRTQGIRVFRDGKAQEKLFEQGLLRYSRLKFAVRQSNTKRH